VFAPPFSFGELIFHSSASLYTAWLPEKVISF
jgi:hypothetical protein